MLWLQAVGQALAQSLELVLHQAPALTLPIRAKTPLEVSCISANLIYCGCLYKICVSLPAWLYLALLCMTFLHAWCVTSWVTNTMIQQWCQCKLSLQLVHKLLCQAQHMSHHYSALLHHGVHICVMQHSTQYGIMQECNVVLQHMLCLLVCCMCRNFDVQSVVCIAVLHGCQYTTAAQARKCSPKALLTYLTSGQMLYTTTCLLYL